MPKLYQIMNTTMKKETPPTIGIEAFANCPPSELWRCLVSRNRQAGVSLGEHGKGPLSQDSLEKGYLQGVFSGLEFILAELSSKTPKKLDADFLLELHKRTTANVFEEVPIPDVLETRFVPIDHNYRDITGTGFRINIDQNNPGNNATVKGIRELVVEFKEGYSYFVKIGEVKTELKSEAEILAAIANGDIVAIESRPLPSLSPQQIRQSVIDRVNQILLVYQNMPKSTEDEILEATAITIRSLEVLHPFKDANCRTLNLLRQFILMQNGLFPRVITNNDRIDAYAISELVEEMRQGKQTFHNIISGLSDLKQFNVVNESGKTPYQQFNEHYFQSLSCPIGNKPILCGLVAKHLLQQIPSFNKLHPKRQASITKKLSSQLIAKESWTPAQLDELRELFVQYCRPTRSFSLTHSFSTIRQKSKTSLTNATHPQKISL